MTTVCFLILQVLFCCGDPQGETKLRLEMLDGSTKEVDLTEIRPDRRLFFDSGRQHIALDDLSSITPLNASSKSSPAGPQSFFLAYGGQVTGKIIEMPSEAGRMIRADLNLSESVVIPFYALKAIRFGPADQPAAEAELQSKLKNPPTGKDLLIVAQDDRPVVLPGALERVTPAGWEFTVGHKTQRQALDAAYAVILGAPPMDLRPKEPGRGDMVHLGSDDVLMSLIRSADRREIQVSSFQDLAIPWERITSISLHSGRVIYLSDLTVTIVKNSSVLDVDFPPRMNAAVTGGPLALRGRHYDKGIGVHARSQLEFKLDAQFDRLLGTIGIDDDAAPIASAVFRIHGDGKLLYESPVLRLDDQPKPINVPLGGARTITLECDDAGDLDIADHCDWADVRVIGASAVH